jgi:hypothetical protein
MDIEYSSEGEDVEMEDPIAYYKCLTYSSTDSEDPQGLLSFLQRGDVLMLLFENLISLHYEEALEDYAPSCRHGVALSFSRDVLWGLGGVCKETARICSSNEFLRAMHYACYNKRELVGSVYQSVSFQFQCLSEIGRLEGPSLKENYFKLLFGDVDALKRKHDVVFELSRRAAITLPVVYVAAVFYNEPKKDETEGSTPIVKVRRAKSSDPPDYIVHIPLENFDLMLLSQKELNTNLILNTSGQVIGDARKYTHAP